MKSVLSLGLVCMMWIVPRAAALEAIRSYTVADAIGGYVPGGAGFAFSPQTNMAVTALGFNGNGLNTGPYRVILWSNGRQLASVLVTLNSSFLNQTFYAAVPRIQLVQGQTYHLSAAGTNSYWVGNLIQTNFSAQRFLVGSDILYLGTAYGTNNAGEFPVGTSDPGAYYVAPNFQYQIGGGTNLVWASTFSTQWDIATSLNWLNLANTQPDRFFNGESVLFDDTRGVVTNINLAAGVTVLPLVVTNKSSTNNFVISGAGQISGTAVLVKDGVSTLTLGTTNDFTGNTIILSGTVKIGSPAALGATNGATLITNSATLDLNGINIGDEPVTASGGGVAGGGAIVNNGPPQTTGLSHLTLAGHVTLGGSNRWDIGGSNSAFLLTGGQPWNITKVGTNQVSLVNVSQIDPALGDVEVQRGTFSIQYATAQLGSPSRFITVRSNAILSLNNLTATPLNRQIVLNDAAALYNEQGPSIVAGPLSLAGTNVLFVSTNGTDPKLTCTGVIAGPGTLRKMGGGILTLTGTNTYTGITLVETSTVALVGFGSISGSASIALNRSTLDVSARNDGRLTLTLGQTLSGDGTVLGSLTSSFGSTVSPGNSIGILTVTNDVVLQGTTFMELNKNTATNDVLQTGTNLIYGGTLVLTNLSGTLAVGDQFKLFNALSYSGAFANIVPSLPAPGMNWDTSLLTTNGTVGVITAQPVITNAMSINTNFVIAGTNGVPTNSYYVLISTNLSLPLTNWPRLATNLFDSAGNFTFTNAFDRTVPKQFYLLQLP